jgi:hypothetical protein
LLSSSLFTLALVLLVDDHLAKLSVNLGVLLLSGNLSGLLSKLSVRLLKEVLGSDLLASLSRLDSVSSSIINISLLGLVSSSWEEDQLAFVLLEALYVGLKSLL